MSERAPNSFAEQVQEGLPSGSLGLLTTDNGQGVSQPQRPCSTPESPDKPFSSVMSPDTTSSAVRHCGLGIASPSIGVGLFQSSEASIEVPTVTHERKKKTHYTPVMLAELEQAFLENNYPTRDDRVMISKRTTLCVDKIKIWFQNRRCKERRRLKSLGRCSSALRMPPIKKTDRDVASVASSTKPAPAPMMYTSVPDMSWCVPSLCNIFKPECSGPLPGSEPLLPRMNTMSTWGQFCVRRALSDVDTLLTTREHQQSSLAPSDISDATQRALSTNANTDGTASLRDGPPAPKKPLLSSAVETDAVDNGSANANCATRHLCRTSQTFDSTAQQKSSDESGTADAVSHQSLSSNSTTVSFIEVKPKLCSAPPEVRRSVAHIRGHGIDWGISTRAEPTLRYSSVAQVGPPLPEEDASGPRLVPLVNVAPLTQHSTAPVDRYAQPVHGAMEFARQPVPLAYHHRYNSASVFGSAGGYSQTCTPSYWYGGAMPQTSSPYAHVRQNDYNPYNMFQNHAAGVGNSRDVPSFQWDAQYEGCQQTARGYTGLRELPGGYDPASYTSVPTTPVDLSWMSGLGSNGTYERPANVYQRVPFRYGLTSHTVGTCSNAGLALSDEAKTSGDQNIQTLENASKSGCFVPRVSSTSVRDFVNGTGAGLCKTEPQPASGSSERDLGGAVYDNEKASDIIDEYHRQMMASYCRKETDDLESNSTATSGDTCAPTDDVTPATDHGQLASVGVVSYSSEGDSSRPVEAVKGDDAKVMIAGDASVGQCSSSCSSPADHTHAVSQTSTYDVFSCASEETNTINCLSDFENSSSEDTRTEQDDIVPAIVIDGDDHE